MNLLFPSFSTAPALPYLQHCHTAPPAIAFSCFFASKKKGRGEAKLPYPLFPHASSSRARHTLAQPRCSRPEEGGKMGLSTAGTQSLGEDTEGTSPTLRLPAGNSVGPGMVLGKSFSSQTPPHARSLPQKPAAGRPRCFRAPGGVSVPPRPSPTIRSTPQHPTKSPSRPITSWRCGTAAARRRRRTP